MSCSNSALTMRRYSPRYCAMAVYSSCSTSILLEIDLAVDQPFQVGVGEFAHRMRLDRCHAGRPAGGPHQPLRAGAEGAQFLVGRLLPRPVQQLQDVDLGQLRHLAQRLVHEDAAAVHRRADRVGRNEQHAQPFRRRSGHCRSGRGSSRPGGGGRPRCRSPRPGRARGSASGIACGQLPERLPDRAQVGAQGQLAEQHRQNRAAPGEEEMARPGAAARGCSSRRTGGSSCCSTRLDVLRRELLPDGAAMLVKHDAARLVEHLPAALPGHVAEVGIFQVEGRQQGIEAAQFEELVAVEGAAIRRRRRSRETGRSPPGRCGGARAGRRPATSPG